MAASIATTTTEVGFLLKPFSVGGGSFSPSISIQASPKSNINTMVVVSEKKERLSFAQTSAVQHLVGSLTKSEGHRFAVETWKETDKLVEETSANRGTNDSPSWIRFKAVSLLMLGITILSILADPLVEVVYNFSDAVNIPSFFVWFIFLPLATNSRRAVSAIVKA